MIQNKELYSYIINSIEVMNKSIIVGEQNTVKLFAYVYNNQNNIYNEINNLNKKCSNIDINIENKILKNDKIIHNIINENNSNVNEKISKLELKVQQLEKQINEQACNTIISPVIIEAEKESFIIKIFKAIKCFFINCYNYCYKIIYKVIFERKIQRQLEEKKRIQESIIQKQEEIKNKQNKRRIKDILNIRNEQ